MITTEAHFLEHTQELLLFHVAAKVAVGFNCAWIAFQCMRVCVYVHVLYVYVFMRVRVFYVCVSELTIDKTTHLLPSTFCCLRLLLFL